jgi:histidine phosphotransferase ChpT
MTDTTDRPLPDSLSNDLAGLVGSRLCHDLISPIGAIGNGLELLELSGTAPTEEMQLIRTAVQAASARISFFRIAFGAAKGEQDISPREVNTTLNAVFADSKTKVTWAVEDSFTRAEVRLAFLALACLETAMPWGGKIEARRSRDAWVLHATAERLKIDEPLWDTLRRSRSNAEITGSTVQFGLLAQSAVKARRPVSVTITESSISLLV